MTPRADPPEPWYRRREEAGMRWAGWTVLSAACAPPVVVTGALGGAKPAPVSAYWAVLDATTTPGVEVGVLRIDETPDACATWVDAIRASERLVEDGASPQAFADLHEATFPAPFWSIDVRFALADIDLDLDEVTLQVDPANVIGPQDGQVEATAAFWERAPTEPAYRTRSWDAPEGFAYGAAYTLRDGAVTLSKEGSTGALTAVVDGSWSLGPETGREALRVEAVAPFCADFESTTLR